MTDRKNDNETKFIPPKIWVIDGKEYELFLERPCTGLYAVEKFFHLRLKELEETDDTA